MSYVVVSSQRATRFLDKASTSTREQFQQIAELLEDDPFPAPDFPFIQERSSPEGRTFYRYLDDLFPYALEYRVYPLDASRGGLVFVGEIVLP